jgi:hypothetical protein
MYFSLSQVILSLLSGKKIKIETTDDMHIFTGILD